MSASYYAIIPANVRYDKGLNANAKLLYGEITALCNKEGYCWATNKYFADLYSTSERTIQRWIKNLIDKGYVQADYIYRQNSKEIEQRKLIICGEKNNTTSRQECQEGNDKNVTTPHDKNVADNNTLVNNTINITEEVGQNMDKCPKKVIKNIGYTKEFLKWYELYPNPWNKSQSFKNFKTLMKNETFENLILATKNYINYIKKKGTSKEFIVRSTNFIGQHQEYKGYLEMQEEKKEVEQRANCGAYKEWQGRKSING